MTGPLARWRAAGEKRRRRHEDLILAILAARPSGRFHYGMWRLTSIPPGAIYVALARLERAGLVLREKVMMLPPGRPPRTLYKATDAGRKAAADPEVTP